MSATTDRLLDKQEEERQHRFDAFLEKKCWEENPQVLDDDMPDFLNDWLSELEPDRLIELGNEAMSNGL